jgi:hypothetical protein
MITHGWFHEKHRDRPMIIAGIFHESIGFSRSLHFVIDTGAEKTLIVPYYEKLLSIPQDKIIVVGYSQLVGPKCSIFKVVFCSSSPFFLFASFSFLLNIVTLLHLPNTPALEPQTANLPWPDRCRNTPRQGSCNPAIDADARCYIGQNNHSNHDGLHPQLSNP